MVLCENESQNEKWKIWPLCDFCKNSLVYTYQNTLNMFPRKNLKRGGLQTPPKDPPNLRELMGGQNLPNYIGTILSLNISNKKSFSGGSIPVLQSIQARKPDLQATEQPCRLKDQKNPFFALIDCFSEIRYSILGKIFSSGSTPMLTKSKNAISKFV